MATATMTRNANNPALWVAAVAAPVLISHAPSFLHRLLDGDEAIYGSIAALMNLGDPLYAQGGVDNKPPGIFWVYAVTFRVFGMYQMTAVHAIALLAIAATCVLIFLVGRHLAGTRVGILAVDAAAAVALVRIAARGRGRIQAIGRGRRIAAAAGHRLLRATRKSRARVSSVHRRPGRGAAGGRRAHRAHRFLFRLLAVDDRNPDRIRERQLGSRAGLGEGEGQHRPLHDRYGRPMDRGDRVGSSLEKTGFGAAAYPRLAGGFDGGIAGRRASLVALLHPGHGSACPAGGARDRCGSAES